MKINISKDENQDEEVRKELNNALPDDITVFAIIRPSNRFNSKLNADDREYSYYLPTFMLRSIK